MRLEMASVLFGLVGCAATSATNNNNNNNNNDPTTTCTPGEFVACTDDGTASICNDTGDGVEQLACGGGCDADAARCNECVPDTSTCTDDTTVGHCGPDGLLASTESCALACGDAGGTAACTSIVPAWIPTACDIPIADSTLAFGNVTLDTDQDATCTGGVIAQPEGPSICVVRAGTITIGSVLKAVGSRPIAFVADGALDVAGRLDVSADANIPGPGGSFFHSGGTPTVGGGGGGAGFKQVGGDGGGGEFGGGASGGLRVDPLTRLAFFGGAGSAVNLGVVTQGNFTPVSGAGGGGLLLVSCRGTVDVTGEIDAGGGGGGAGGDRARVTRGTQIVGAAGGGAGGYVVIQGAQVRITGVLTANGGGGGGGCDTDNCIGAPGTDGSSAFSTGGPGCSNGIVGLAACGGRGGQGDARVPTSAPNNQSSDGHGGGGGSVGVFQIYTPAGVIPFVDPATAEPAPQPTLTVETR